MKMLLRLILLVTILCIGILLQSCKIQSCDTGYCSIEQKKLQSYSDYRKHNRKQYITKVSKVEAKYIDIKSKKLDNNQTAILNPKFK